MLPTLCLLNNYTGRTMGSAWQLLGTARCPPLCGRLRLAPWACRVMVLLLLSGEPRGPIQAIRPCYAAFTLAATDLFCIALHMLCQAMWENPLRAFSIGHCRCRLSLTRRQGP